jgi:hypothetical protein
MHLGVELAPNSACLLSMAFETRDTGADSPLDHWFIELGSAANFLLFESNVLFFRLDISLIMNVSFSPLLTLDISLSLENMK